MAKNESAEQKLLQMIEASSGASSAAPSTSKPAKKAKKKRSVSTILRLVNVGLIVLLLVSFIFLFREISIGSKGYNKKIQFSIDKYSARKIDQDALFPVIEKVSYYLAKVDERNIFKPYVKPEGSSEVITRAQTSTLEIFKKIENIKLVGVSWMDKVETASVMLEDVQKKKTYFLQKGEKINDIFVKTIYADSALLGYKDEEIIIRYEKSQK